jgi:sugar lactone lactonase YvrE
MFPSTFDYVVATSLEEAIAAKAEALTEEQISQSRDINGLTKLSEIYDSVGDTQRFTWALKRLTELLPDSGQLRLQLAMVYSKEKKLSNAYDILVRMQGQGFGYDIAKDPRFDNIHGTKVWDYIVANMQANAKPFGEGKVAFELPKGDYLFESIGYDPARQKFLVGSAREGKVYLAGTDGKIAEFIAANAENGMWAVLDLAVDASRDKLYVASSDMAFFKGFKPDDFGQGAVFEFQLSSGKFLHKYPIKDGGRHILTNITVGKDGRVYVGDSIRRDIYRIDGEELKLLVENSKLTSLRGMAVSDDGKTLYLADYALGIFGIDLTKTEPFVLAHNPEKLVLGGIDGLYYYDGCLVIIDGGMVPQRVMRLKLAADGRSIESAMPLDVAQPAFSAPTLGAVAGDELYFIANSQKGLYDRYGVLKDPAKLESTRIYKSNLRFAWDQSGIPTAVSDIAKRRVQEMSQPKPPEAKDKDGGKDKDDKH